ncbi:MAG: hypothetical protein GY757_39305 [bacterium]|nr:hypothetical protein [bacterium]
MHTDRFFSIICNSGCHLDIELSDSSKLYIGFRCFDPEQGQIRAHLMDRMAKFFVRDDYVTVMLDTFNDARRAFRSS